MEKARMRDWEYEPSPWVREICKYWWIGFILAIALGAANACDSGSWPKPTSLCANIQTSTDTTLIPQSLAREEKPCISADSQYTGDETEYAEELQDQPGGRIPPAIIRGKTNTRFQYSSMSDIPIYVYYHYAKPWIAKHRDQILKYAPKLVQVIVKWNEEKNYILAASPAAIKVLRKK